MTNSKTHLDLEGYVDSFLEGEGHFFPQVARVADVRLYPFPKSFDPALSGSKLGGSSDSRNESPL